MHAAPAGFVFLPGTERDGALTYVFEVEQGTRRLVCKRLAPRGLDEPWVRERLVGEGRVLAMLDGRGAPRLVAAGEDARGPWLVMERLAWPTLAAFPREKDARTWEAAIHGAFAALARVHAAGVVHADVSPDNVLVAGDGAGAALVDFGLARWAEGPPMPPGPFRGTLAYAAPELARGEAFDARADLFAMAASLLHVRSGQPPRPGTSEPAMLLAAGEEGLEVWASRAAAGLEAGLAAALVACCAFDPARRPATAEALRRR